jgi:hypothetical protein
MYCRLDFPVFDLSFSRCWMVLIWKMAKGAIGIKHFWRNAPNFGVNINILNEVTPIFA